MAAIEARLAASEQARQNSETALMGKLDEIGGKVDARLAEGRTINAPQPPPPPQTVNNQPAQPEPPPRLKFRSPLD